MGAHPAARGARAGLTAILAAAALLRAGQALLRWDEVALAYAAYVEPAVRALARGDLRGLAAAWVGLHPPLYAVLVAAEELWAGRPVLLLLGMAALSWAAVALAGRAGGPVAAAVLGSAPVQLLYAGEVMSYPVAVAALAATIAAARGPWWVLAAAAVAAAWSHVLAATGAAAVVLWRLLHPQAPGERGRLAAAALLGAAPVAAGALRLALDPGNWSQPPVGAGEWARLVLDATGWGPVLLVPLVALGLRGPALAAWLGVALPLGAAWLGGSAALHQRPYLVLLGPPAALAVARAVRGRPALAAAVLALCALRAGAFAADELGRARAVAADLRRERAVDVAAAESAPGDVLWLVAPALTGDDDRRATSPVLWRFPPWERMPPASPVPIEYRDWRYGQPRAWRGRFVHTSTELAPAPFDHVAAATLGAGHRVWVVLYDHAPAAGLLGRVRRTLRPYRAEERAFPDSGDRLWRVEGLRP